MMESTIDGALARLGVRADTLNDADREQLDRDGFAVFPALLDRSTVAAVRARMEELEAEEDAWGAGTNPRDPGAVRVDDVNHKGDVFDALWTHPVLLAAMRHYLGDFRLSSMTGRAARPHTGHQHLHVDWWGAFEEGSVACNSGWLLSDFTKENGATRIVPGSHRWGRRPEDDMPDPGATHPDQIQVVAPAGSLMVFNGYLWHGGTENTTDDLRRGVFTVYSRRDQPRQNDQAGRLDDATAARLDAGARYVLDA
jgi:ectoine hydroxylase-related dioxygenase (phytanoyl-CoA dioxygenase family)